MFHCGIGWESGVCPGESCRGVSEVERPRPEVPSRPGKTGLGTEHFWEPTSERSGQLVRVGQRQRRAV